MRDLRFAPPVVEAAIDAGLALINGGTLIVYTDPRPSSVTDPPPADALQLLSFSLPNPAFAAASGEAAVANAIAPATAGANEGQARWFRVNTSAGDPAVGGTVDADGTGDLVLSKYSIFNGDSVSVVNFTVVLPSGA